MILFSIFTHFYLDFNLCVVSFGTVRFNSTFPIILWSFQLRPVFLSEKSINEGFCSRKTLLRMNEKMFEWFQNDSTKNSPRVKFSKWLGLSTFPMKLSFGRAGRGEGKGDRNKIERIRSNGIRSNEIDMLKIFTWIRSNPDLNCLSILFIFPI